MEINPSGRATLVVIEFGGSWPGWLNPSAASAAGGALAVVAQHYEGHPSELLTQVASRLSRLENGGWRLGRVVLVSNGRVDSGAETSRAVLCRALLTHGLGAGLSELVLTHGNTDDRRVERGLNRLVNALVAEPDFLRVRVSHRGPAARQEQRAAVRAM